MDRNERNTMDQNARKRTVRREGNAAGSTRANEGLEEDRRETALPPQQEDRQEKAVRHLYEEHRKAAIRPEEQRRAERLPR